MSQSVAEKRRSQLQQATGLATGNITDLEWNFYSANSGLTPPNKYSISDHKLAYYKLNGATGSALEVIEQSFFRLQGAQGKSAADVAYDFFTNYGYGLAGMKGIQLWLEADAVNGQTLAYDNFDRSKNLLNALDPSFETGVSNWSVGNGAGAAVVSSTAQVHRGGKSMLVTYGNANDAGAQLPSITVLPNTTYTLSTWVYQPSLVGNGLAAGVYFPVTSRIVYGPRSSVIGSWIYLTLTFTTGATENLVVILPANTGSTAPAAAPTAYVDDVQLELGSVATPFTWGDSTHLGVSQSGHAWNLIQGDHPTGVSGGQFAAVGATLDTANVIDVGTADQDISAKFNAITGGAGITFRVTDGTTYYFVGANSGTGTNLNVYKRVASSYTQIAGGGTLGTMSDGDTLRVSMVGSTITIWKNGNQVTSFTDTSFTTGSKAGIWVSSGSGAVRVTSFSVKTPTYTGGSPLPVWPDKSGNYRHALQQTASKQPLYRDGSSNPNLLPYDTATFAISTGGWVPLHSATATRDTSRTSGYGSATQKVVVNANDAPTIGAGITSYGLTGLTVGQQYTVSCWLDNTSTKNFAISISGSGYGNTIAAGTAGRTSYTFTATSSNHSINVGPANLVTPVIGEVVYISAVAFKAGTDSTFIPPITIPNQKACVQFDGLDDWFATVPSSFPAIMDRTVFAIAKDEFGSTGGFGGRNIIDGKVPTSSGERMAIAHDNSTIYWQIQNGAAATTSTTARDTNIHLFSMAVSGTTQTLFLDGTQIVSGTSNPITSVSGMHIATYDESTAMWLGTIAAVIVFNRVLSTSERQRVERYLKAKYGTP